MNEPTQGRKPNQLINETSPYLLQHAYNPVDWYPWNNDALSRAKQENKPILLSIGYSACHWCHVMEHESFENDEIAALMNTHFINIKVDREERPDLDEIYMQATVSMNQGHGGWPMTVFLTPDQEPIFAGTYFPPTDKWGTARLLDRCFKISRQAWEKDRESIVKQATRFTSQLRDSIRVTSPYDCRADRNGDGPRTILKRFRCQIRRIWASPEISPGNGSVVSTPPVSSNER